MSELAVIRAAATIDKATATDGVEDRGAATYALDSAVYPDPEEPWGDPFRQPIIGQLGKVEARQIELTATGRTRQIRVAPDASVYTDSSATLGDFLPGELVAVEGQMRDGEFEATAIWSAVTSIFTRVRAARRGSIDTDHGRIAITPNTRRQAAGSAAAQLNPSQLKPATEIFVEVRMAPGLDPIATVVKIL